MSTLADDAIHRITLHPLVECVLRTDFVDVAQLWCDAYVDRVESLPGVSLTPWGWVHGAAENIDHHAPHSVFETTISSANLALRRVAACGIASADVPVHITHTDCDSILSAGIVSGVLPAHDVFGEAAIAADHTGAPHAIADLLQAIEHTRSLHESFSALEALLAGHTLPKFADRALNERQARREQAAAAVRDGRFTLHDGFAWADFDEAMEGEFFPALLPEARVIVTASPHPGDSTRRQVRVRLGQSAREGETLHALGFSRYDATFGGRWNAGSNKRGGGTELSAAEWVAGYRAWAERRDAGDQLTREPTRAQAVARTLPR
jgi:hypothetical protein